MKYVPRQFLTGYTDKLATHKKLKFLRVCWLVLYTKHFTEERKYFLVLNNIRWFNIDICYEMSFAPFVFAVFPFRKI